MYLKCWNIKDEVDDKFALIKGTWLQIFVALSVSLSNMCDGMSVGWISAKIAELTNTNSTTHISLEDASWIATVPLFSSLLMTPFAIYSANAIGRKYTVIWGSFLTFISWSFVVKNDQLSFILIGSIFRGLGGFIIYTISQIYIAEISQYHIRGVLGSFTAISMNLGIFLSYVCAMYFPLSSIASISLMIGAVVFPAMYFAPLSPYFLFMKKKPKAARSSLILLRNEYCDIDSELDDIKYTIDNREDGTVRELFMDAKNRKILFLVLMVQIFQQLIGIDCLLMFLQVILDESGGALSSSLSSVIFGAVKLFSCSVGLVLIDKLGRRLLLISSSIFATIALLILGGYFYHKDALHQDMSSLSWLPLSSLIFYVLSYNVGLGTVPFILGSEMFPPKFKALGVIANQIAYCLSMILTTQFFAWLKENYGFHVGFWFLSSCGFVAIVFFIFFIVETKGKTFKEILDQLE